MRAKGAGDETQSADEQDKHHQCVEQAGRPEIDVHVGQHARKDEKGTSEGKNPTGDAATVPKQKAYAKQHGHQREPKVFAPKKLQKEPTTLT
jgi:hypothetical protein